MIKCCVFLTQGEDLSLKSWQSSPHLSFIQAEAFPALTDHFLQERACLGLQPTAYLLDLLPQATVPLLIFHQVSVKQWRAEEKDWKDTVHFVSPHRSDPLRAVSSDKHNHRKTVFCLENGNIFLMQNKRCFYDTEAPKKQFYLKFLLVFKSQSNG